MARPKSATKTPAAKQATPTKASVKKASVKKASVKKAPVKKAPVKKAAATASNDNTPSAIGAPAAAAVVAAVPVPTIAPRGVFLPDRIVVDLEGDTFPSTKLDEHGRDEAVLPGTTLDQIKQHAADGQRLVERDPVNAFRTFRAALELLPQPHQNWNAAGWLLVAMGEAAIRAGDFERALVPLKDAMHCPGTIGNPWVHLRLGQARLELADERAVDDLSRAYMGGGRALFDGLDAKYFAVVEQALVPPPGHDHLP